MRVDNHYVVKLRREGLGGCIHWHLGKPLCLCLGFTIFLLFSTVFCICISINQTTTSAFQGASPLILLVGFQSVT